MALTGNLWVPVWAIRPGSYRALVGLDDAMPLWLAIHSRCTDYHIPLYASRETLGATIGKSRNTIGRQLLRLKKAALLFEVKRPPDRKTQRRRPPARWAIDPFAPDDWREEVEKALHRVAEQDGHDGRWLQRALTSLDSFDRRSRLLAARIAEDMPIVPKRRRRRGKKRSGPRDHNGPGGGIYTTGTRGKSVPVVKAHAYECGSSLRTNVTAITPAPTPATPAKAHHDRDSQLSTAKHGAWVCKCGSRIPQTATSCATCAALHEEAEARG